METVALREIVKWGDPVLHAPSDRVTEIDGSVGALVKDMVETMYAAPGIGLAAPQIGVPLRVIVIDLSVGEEKGQLITLINPQLVEREGEQRHEEGCLSVPGFGATPVRPARVVVKGLDLEGTERVYTGTELLARAFCHEIDHIDGLLFVDRLTPLKRDLMKRKLRKKARSHDWDEKPMRVGFLATGSFATPPLARRGAGAVGDRERRGRDRRDHHAHRRGARHRAAAPRRSDAHRRGRDRRGPRVAPRGPGR